MLTPDQIRQATKLRAAHRSYRRIGEILGVSAKSVRSAITPRTQYRKPFPREHRVLKRITPFIPQAVLDERERMYQARMTTSLTLGQQLLGDPMPGKSALDQQKRST